MKYFNTAWLLFLLILSFAGCATESRDLNNEHDMVSEEGSDVPIGGLETSGDGQTSANTTTSNHSASHQLDLLFYIKTKNSACLFQFVKHASTDFAFVDWQIAFAFFSHAHDLLPLQMVPGHPYRGSHFFKKRPLDFVLSMGEYSKKRGRRLLKGTLSAARKEDIHCGRGGHCGRDNAAHLNENLSVTNPLLGLDAILNHPQYGFPRQYAHVVVLLFGDLDDFPSYFDPTWQTFFANHPDVSLIGVTASLSVLANQVQNDGYGDFDSLPICENMDQAGDLFGSGAVARLQNHVQGKVTGI